MALKTKIAIVVMVLIFMILAYGYCFFDPGVWWAPWKGLGSECVLDCDHTNPGYRVKRWHYWASVGESFEDVYLFALVAIASLRSLRPTIRVGMGLMALPLGISELIDIPQVWSTGWNDQSEVYEFAIIFIQVPILLMTIRFWKFRFPKFIQNRIDKMEDHYSISFGTKKVKKLMASYETQLREMLAEQEALANAADKELSFDEQIDGIEKEAVIKGHEQVRKESAREAERNIGVIKYALEAIEDFKDDSDPQNLFLVEKSLKSLNTNMHEEKERLTKGFVTYE